MECNKDEAVRAKEIAEDKMMNNDFEGARKLALKARRLFPELDSISQMLAVCDVHCSAQRKIHGSEKDLYGILQVESLADEATIKKQYRKLALVLHPDKNKFPGAEAAFKLIGEANMILSDKGKRSLHDIKCREPARPTVPTPQNHQRNQNPYDGMQFGAQINGMNHHRQQSQSFWTHCPFCKIKHEYYREMINRPLRCQNCSKLFIAYDMGVQQEAPAPHSAHAGTQSGNLGSNSGRSAFSQQKEAGRQGNVNVDAQMAGGFSSNFAHQTCSSTGVQSTQGNTNTKGGKEGVAMPKPREARVSKGTNRKKGRKMVVESSDEEDAFVGASADPSVDCDRKSSRKRPQVSYSEEAGDGLSPAKRRRQDTQKKQVPDYVKKDVPKPQASDHAEEGIIPNDHSKSDSDSEENLEPVYIDCPDLEFSNFDKDKEERCFAVDQIWACYDTIDGMPRFYAHIRKVYSNGFRLRITWLEADPDNHLEIIWAEEGLPVACGKFVRGDTEETRERLMFSHQMVYEKGKKRFSYVIYPKKGETWALFKDWDIKWGSDLKSHTKFKFDIVEVLSDFDDDNGVLVAYMIKVEGFVSLFQRTKLSEHTIPSSEVFRFSHRIPSVKLTGTERADVPVGSCELDTASLPDDLNEYYFSNKVNLSAQTSDSCPQSPEPKVKPGTPKNETDGSPRGSKGNFEQSNGVEDKSNNQDDIDVKTSSNGFKTSPKPSVSKKEKLIIIHDFNVDKQNRKFQEGEIWALERSPRCYAQIKKIESSPLRLHVDLLELCTASNNTNGPNGCGLFKASIDSRQIFSPDSFLYLVKAELNGKNRFNIYPKEKEIWSLYKKQDFTSTLPDRGAGECDIVEVLENDGHIVKVLSLSRVPGYKSVFRAREIQSSKVSVLRFAYRIPAFLLTEEQGGQLRGCWELDLA